MNASQFAILADQVRKLPEGATGRSRYLLRLTDLHASSAAATALHAAASRVAQDPGVLAGVLTLASSAWPGRPEGEARAEDGALLPRLGEAIRAPEFLSLLPGWVREMRATASSHPGTGACTLGSAFQLWSWTMHHFREGLGSTSESAGQAMDELAEALCPLLAARCLALEIAAEPPQQASAEASLRSDLCHVHAAHAAATVGATCAELVFGYRRHLRWDAEGCATCYCADELDELESWMPGIASGARAAGDVIEADGSHPMKAGPCARFDGVDTFTRLRTRLDGCLTGSRLARDRAAAALARSVGQTQAPAQASEGSA